MSKNKAGFNDCLEKYIFSSVDKNDVDIYFGVQRDHDVSDEIIDANIGDYVVVLVLGKSRALSFIALIDI